MKILGKIKLSKVLMFFKKLPWLMGEHAFLAFLVLFLISLIIGGILFYKYNILIQKMKPEVIESPFQFEEAAYRKILEEWEIREKKFAEAQFKEYPDPFSK